MTKAKDLAYQVNEVLGAYVGIHDAIFKFSIRRLLPIPGLFEPIDYCTYETTLLVLSVRLGEVCNIEIPTAATTSGSEKELLGVLNDYALALQNTIARLAGISHSLCRKSKGEPGYRYSSYRDDVNAYDASVQRYLAFGARLNALYAAV